jgi:hypothetical protein
VPVLTGDDRLEQVQAMRLRALSWTEPPASTDERGVVDRLIDDRLVLTGTLIEAPLLHHVAEIDAAPTQDVLDRVSGPRLSAR